jgi:hypothetical protein
MCADSQFADEDIQRGLQSLGFGGAASQPNPSPPAHPQRDNDDRAGRDDADRKYDRQRHRGDARAWQNRELAACGREKAECSEPAMGL